MIIGIQGTEPGREDDPISIIAPSPLDAPVLGGQLTKAHREDLQILSFAFAVSLTTDSGHPIDIRQGGDPPDRVVYVNGRAQFLELTELTMFDVRQELAQARHLGRALAERLKSDASRFSYLVGRRVALAVLPNEPLPRDTGPLLDALCGLLKEDRGCVGDGVDVTKGLPERWPMDRGLYGQSGPVHVSVYPNGFLDEIFVSAECQTEIRLSETIGALELRVRAKDTQASEILVITCGMPDERGYVCAPDTSIFQFIAENRDRLRLSPKHLKGVYLHLWGTPTWLQLYRADNSVLWPSTPVGGTAAA
jgi:hypothetical protein